MNEAQQPKHSSQVLDHSFEAKLNNLTLSQEKAVGCRFYSSKQGQRASNAQNLHLGCGVSLLVKQAHDPNVLPSTISSSDDFHHKCAQQLNSSLSLGRGTPVFIRSKLNNPTVLQVLGGGRGLSLFTSEHAQQPNRLFAHPTYCCFIGQVLISDVRLGQGWGSYFPSKQAPQPSSPVNHSQTPSTEVSLVQY